MKILLIMMETVSSTAWWSDVDWSAIAISISILVLGAGIKLYSDVNVLKSQVRDIRTDLDNLRQDVANYQHNVLNSLLVKLFDRVFQKASPIGLTPEGLKMAQESGINDLIKNNLVHYQERLDNFQTGVELFDQCEQIVKELPQDNELLNIREYFYNQALDWFVVQRIISIRIRDMYLDSKTNSKSRVDKLKPAESRSRW